MGFFLSFAKGFGANFSVASTDFFLSLANGFGANFWPLVSSVPEAEAAAATGALLKGLATNFGVIVGGIAGFVLFSFLKYFLTSASSLSSKRQILGFTTSFSASFFNFSSSYKREDLCYD